jgi:hypothetical protein
MVCGAFTSTTSEKSDLVAMDENHQPDRKKN